MAENHKLSIIIGMAAGIFGVLATLLTLPYWAGNIASDVAAHTKMLDVQRADIDTLQKDVGCLKVDVKGIQVDTTWLRLGIERVLDMQTKHYRVAESINKLLKKETKPVEEADVKRQY